MRRYGLLSGLLAAIILSTFSVAGASSDCERAAAIRRDVRASTKMPPEIKEELLERASGLCPEKGDVGAVLNEGEALFSHGKFSDALELFQKAVRLMPKQACPKVFKAARSLVKGDKPDLARAFYETGLSSCPDEDALKEYDKLVKEAPSAQEAKGPSEFIKRDVIVESLQGERPGSGGRDSSRRRVRDEDAPKVVFHSILFESGSATLTPSSRDQLDELGQALASSRLAHVGTFYIDGHTDSVGTEDRNCELAYQRARSVIRYLVEKWDIRSSRLAPQSFGQYRPVASNTTQLGRLLNRRVEVRNGDAVEPDDYDRRGRCR